jgi:hypothetical protein
VTRRLPKSPPGELAHSWSQLAGYLGSRLGKIENRLRNTGVLLRNPTFRGSHLTPTTTKHTPRTLLQGWSMDKHGGTCNICQLVTKFRGPAQTRMRQQ